MDKSVVLSVGDVFHLKRGKGHIAYAGMPSENVFSIVQIKNAYFNNALAWNLCFPGRKSEITIDRVNLIVENVSPEEIGLHIG